MKYLNPYRERILEELSFLEWTDTRLFESVEAKPVPMPVRTDALIQQMKQADELPPALYLEGMVLLLSADPDFVHADTYRRILSKEKGVAAALSRRAFEWRVEEDNLRALSYALTAFQLNPNDSLAKALIAVLYAEDGSNHSPAIRRLSEEVALDEAAEPDSRELIARLYFAQGDYARAESVLSRIVYEKGSERPASTSELLREIRNKKYEQEARYALNRGDYQAVIDDLHDMDPEEKTGETWFHLAQAHQGLGDFSNSIPLMENAISGGYIHVDAYNDLSIAHYMSGNLEDAIHVSLRARELFGDDERVLYNLLIYRLQQEAYEEAQELLEKLQAMNIADPEIRKSLDSL